MRERYAYVRVSTQTQHVDRQVENIRKHYPDIDNEHMFIEKISGKRGVDDRAEYAVLRRILRAGDELVLDALDRLGRNKVIIKEEMGYLKNKGVMLRILTIPTTLIDMDENNQAWAIEMINNLLIEVYTSLAEQELTEKERRQRDGIEAAKKRGVYKGRQPIHYDEVKLADIYPRWKSGAVKSKEYMELLGLKPNTFYRAIERYEACLAVDQSRVESKHEKTPATMQNTLTTLTTPISVT